MRHGIAITVVATCTHAELLCSGRRNHTKPSWQPTALAGPQRVPRADGSVAADSDFFTPRPPDFLAQSGKGAPSSFGSISKLLDRSMGRSGLWGRPPDDMAALCAQTAPPHTVTQRRRQCGATILHEIDNCPHTRHAITTITVISMQ